MENLTEMLKGVLEGCVLEIISRNETYGYGITRRLNTLGFKDVVDGTVYTILVRLEKNKLVDIEKNRPIWGRRESFTNSTIKGAKNCVNFGINGTSYHQKSTD